MPRFGVILAGIALLVAPAAAQTGSIQWSMNVKGSIERAKSTRQPLMFWVVGSDRDTPHEIERDQKRAFRHPLVVDLSQRFIPVRLPRALYPDLLEKWHVPGRASLWIVFTTPEGDRLAVLDSAGATKADSLAQKMALTFRLYRQQLFDKELRPKLEDEKAPVGHLKIALDVIEKYTILTADQSVIKLLERRGLDQSVEKRCYDVLGTLSTQACVTELLKRAADGDELAADALGRCTPAAAEQMLFALGGEDPDLHVTVYRAMTKICNIRNVKSDRFWDGKNERVKKQEIERVTELVRETARRWKEQYEEYR